MLKEFIVNSFFVFGRFWLQTYSWRSGDLIDFLFCNFCQQLRSTSVVIPKIIPQPLPSILLFPDHPSIRLHFGAMLLTETLNKLQGYCPDRNLFFKEFHYTWDVTCIHSFYSLSSDRSTALSKESSPQSAI